MPKMWQEMGTKSMNNKRIGKMAVTAIISISSAITAVAVTELTKGIKKDVERTEKERRSTYDNLYHKH